MIQLEPYPLDLLHPRITVIGVGGGGGNAVARMIAGDAPGINFILANTDAQALNGSSGGRHLQLGREITEGLGAGSHASVGQAAAEESLDDINLALEGAHMCFIAAGMGGGTGTGAAPVIAKAARDKGILTVAVVTTPFDFEGSRRARAAAVGIEELQKHVDTLIVIPNQNLFRIASPQTTFKEAFAMADEVLQQGVRGITDLMVMPGLVNLDFADVRTVMGAMGKAMMGSGEASGDNRALEAAELAICNPLLDGAIKGARGIIISITGGEDMRLMEIDEAANHIKDMIDPEADIIWGSAINPGFEGRMRVSIVATGLDLIEDDDGASAEPAAELVQKPLPFLFPPARNAAEARAAAVALDGAPDAPDMPEQLPWDGDETPFLIPLAAAESPELGDVLAEEREVARPAPHHPSYWDGGDLLERPVLKNGDQVQPLSATGLPLGSFPALPAPSPAPGKSVSKVLPRTSGSSLFERVSRLVQTAVGHDPVATRRSALGALEAPGVYDRSGRTITAGKSLRPPAMLVGLRRSNGIAAMQSYPGWQLGAAGEGDLARAS